MTTQPCRSRRTLLLLLLLLVGLALGLDLAYFIDGSQELFPTAEQTAAVRLVTGVGAIPLSLLAWLIIRRLRRDG